ncbi:hypothetical protein GQR58_024743 [Nymphon striatum]|nr:hypothetical protein GQR58_024743 [Nymphon striatum]
MFTAPSNTTSKILEDKGVLSSAETQSQMKMGRAVLSDAKEALSVLKTKRSTHFYDLREKTSAILIEKLNHVRESRSRCSKVSDEWRSKMIAFWCTEIACTSGN